MSDDAMAEFARRLFGRADPEPPDDQPTTPSNHVPREGNNPTGTSGDIETFTRALFERALH